MIKDSVKNIAHDFAIWAWGKQIPSEVSDLEEFFLRFLTETYDPDEKKEPLTPYEIRTAVMVYEMNQIPNHIANNDREKVAKEILKIARLLRDGE